MGSRAVVRRLYRWRPVTGRRAMVDGVFATKNVNFWRFFQTVVLVNTPVVQWAAVVNPEGYITMSAFGAVPGCRRVRGWGGKGRRKQRGA
jgi:hypothetical protein